VKLLQQQKKFCLLASGARVRPLRFIDPLSRSFVLHVTCHNSAISATKQRAAGWRTSARASPSRGIYSAPVLDGLLGGSSGSCCSTPRRECSDAAAFAPASGGPASRNAGAQQPPRCLLVNSGAPPPVQKRVIFVFTARKRAADHPCQGTW
jgi:hypothetical protein